MSRPNLFKHATSELSQDAFLCWLLEWADPAMAREDPEMHAIGQEFVRRCLQGSSSEGVDEIRSVQVRTQYAKCDVIALVNDRVVILIEDKAGTREHSDQLARYRSALGASPTYGGKGVVPVYIQTGDQANYAAIEKAGYHVILRGDLLQVLGKGRRARSANAILSDFFEHLSKIETEVLSFRTDPLEDWSWRAWQGFYTELKRALGTGSWGYVANAGGGFQGFWWGWRGHTGNEQYLQLEQDALCFKIQTTEPDRRAELRREWNARVIDAGKELGLDVRRPARMGSGSTMTVARLEGDYRVGGPDRKLDWGATLQRIKLAEQVLERAITDPLDPPTILA